MILPLYSELTFQYRGYIDILQHNQYKLTEITKGLEYLLYEKRQRKLALVFLEERDYVGDLLNICKYLFEVNEKGTRLFLVDVSGVNGHKTIQMKFCLKRRKH